ncbi:MAG TPA: FAD-linked oxidase C-terminal domain-containing protein, partial [Acidimicrobiales bacterium]
IEADRTYKTGDLHVLLVLDEGDPGLVDATVEVVEEECAVSLPLDVALVEQWMGHRNNVAQLEQLIGGGLVVDTMEITGSWSALPGIYRDAVAAIKAVPGTLAASAHQSHAYPDGACLYFTFAGKPDAADKDSYYRAAWDAGTRAVLAGGGALSHHHGVGINRARFMTEAMGAAHGTLIAVKAALDPKGILNPGKLGLPSPFGPNPFAEQAWPTRP